MCQNCGPCDDLLSPVALRKLERARRPDPLNWRWNVEMSAYVYKSNGSRVPDGRVIRAMEDMILAGAEALQTLVFQLFAEDISAEVFSELFLEELTDTYIRAFLFGRGGRAFAATEDWEFIGKLLDGQYTRFEGFVEGIVSGKVSEAQAVMRASMYAFSSRAAFEGALIQALGLAADVLPAMPGDGSTVCLTNCKCHWTYSPVYIESELVGYNFYWNLGIADHCPDCLERSTAWNPLEFRF